MSYRQNNSWLLIPIDKHIPTLLHWVNELLYLPSFKCKHTRALFEGGDPRFCRAFKDVAIRKLTQLDAAQTLEFLRSPPGNQLELLKRDRKGQHSIRINAQFRICFIWTENGPADVEIVDYH